MILSQTDLGDALQIIAGIGAVLVGIATVLERRAAAKSTEVASTASHVSEEARRVSESMQSIIDDLREDATRYRTQLLQAEQDRDLAREERRRLAHELANRDSTIELLHHQNEKLKELVAALEAQLAGEGP